MSLLMKALEKAAQDRDKAADATPAQPAAPVKAQAAPATATATTSSSKPLPSLSLEPMAPTGSVEPRVEPVISQPAAKPAAAQTAAPARAATRNPEQARAAVVLSTKSAAGSSAAAWISAHPVPFTAALAGIFALVYGTYIYLQAAHPSLFLPKPAPQPVAAAKPAPDTAAPASIAAPATPATSAAADSGLVPAQSVFSTRTDAAPASPLTSSAPATPAAPPATAPAATTGSTSKPAPRPAAGAIAAPSPSFLPATPQTRISVSRAESAAPRINAAVADAYAALEAGRFDAARKLYEQALRTEPANIDALLGLAAIAQHENRLDDATRHYLRILDIDPRHALAQTGVIGLAGRADPQAAETRLKQLAARDPSAGTYFTLGNLYADQNQWSQAQQAYFQAHHLDAANPDYAYNLAVALEHIGQPKLALNFYRRAMQLAQGRGRANFNPSQAQHRITQLAARLD
jgi:Tfp pilus assembly protein PilF